MKILVDENIPLLTADELKKLGNDVTDIRATASKGMTDDELWAEAQNRQCLLITTDKGFVARRHESHFGILIVGLRQPNEQKIHSRVMQAMKQIQEVEWPGLLVVMRDTVQSKWRGGS